MALPLLQSGGGGASGGTTVNTKAKVASQWLDSFTSGTGNFTASQPAASDLSVAALANGITATTQAALSNDTKVATDAYVDAAVAAATLKIASPGALLLPWERYTTTTNYANTTVGANAVGVFTFNVRDTITITSAQFVSAANSAATITNFYIGIYSTAGVLLLELKFALTSNQTGVITAVLTPSSFKLTPGTYLYAFGCETAAATITIGGLELNNSAVGITGMLNTSTARVGTKLAMISGGHLVGTGLTAITPSNTAFTSIPYCLVNA